jgi:hypothetical protein
MFAQIGNVLPVFSAYERLYRGHQALMHPLSLVFLDIIKFCISAKEVFRKGKRRMSSFHLNPDDHLILILDNLGIAWKLAWKPFDRQFGSVMQEFRNHAAKVEKEANLERKKGARTYATMTRLQHYHPPSGRLTFTQVIVD